ncbi:hypothetical protein PO909_022414, partial [Leuciscus waleckii]
MSYCSERVCCNARTPANNASMLTLSVSMATSRSFSSSKCDCSSVFCSKQVGDKARLPAHKRRFTATQINPIECIFWCSGHGRWCYECRQNAHCPVLIPTQRNSPSHRARAHDIDPDRLHIKCVSTNTTFCTSQGFCKTKPTCIRSAQADNALSVVNVPAIPRPHSHIDMTGLTGLAQPSPSRLTTAEESSAGNLPAVISAPPASN